MSSTRVQFWSEVVYAQTTGRLPARLRRGQTKTKWTIADVIGELLRLHGHCSHVKQPQPAVHVWGLDSSELLAREKKIYAAAAQIKETYERCGRTHTRRQKRSTPILLAAIASWPEPSMIATNERDAWQARVIKAAQERWGECFRAVYAHVDEGWFHLHLVVDDDGRAVKRLHLGHAYAGEVERRGHARKHQASAYRLGCIAAQNWYHDEVGRPSGWARRSEAPRPRIARPAALRRRQAELEAAEAASVERDAHLAKTSTLIAEQAEQLQRAMAHLTEREARLAVKIEGVKESERTLKIMRRAIQDQYALERRVKSNHDDDPGVF